MDQETRLTDAWGRVSLPLDFANATVIIEQVSESEIRIRKTVIGSPDEVGFVEETAVPLLDGDRDRFLDLLDHPPAANDALKRAVNRQAARHG